MNEYQVKLTFKTKTNFKESDIPALLEEQWEQSGSASEGDSIEILEVVQVKKC